MDRKFAKFNFIIASLIMALSLFILFSVMYSKFTGEQPRVLGYSFHVVVTDSMEPELNAGDFIVAKKAEKEDIKMGDYIIFVSPDPDLKGKLIVHKVIGKENSDGVISFYTQGIKEGAPPDAYPVRQITGKYCAKSALMGKIIIMLSNVQGILFLVLIVAAVIIIVKQIKNIFRLKKENTQTK